MNVEDDPYAKAMLSLHERLAEDIAMLRTAFISDALTSGRHTHASIADLLERTGEIISGYEGSPTQLAVKMLRDGNGPPFLRIIDGGKKE